VELFDALPPLFFWQGGIPYKFKISVSQPLSITGKQLPQKLAILTASHQGHHVKKLYRYNGAIPSLLRYIYNEPFLKTACKNLGEPFATKAPCAETPPRFVKVQK
jgi:hypothetical protein